MTVDSLEQASVRVVLVDEDGTDLVAYEPPEPTDVVEVLRDTGHRLGTAVEHARDFRASPGPRLGADAGNSDRLRRRGASEEVQAPVALRPRTALQLASSGTVLDRDIGAMSVDTSSVDAESGAGGVGRLSWTVSVRTGHLTRRRASLRLRPSPSNNLTIIELIPKRAPWFRTQAFVRAGVPAVRELGDRLRTAAAVVA